MLMLLLIVVTFLPYHFRAQATSAFSPDVTANQPDTFSNIPIDYRYRMLHDQQNEASTFAIVEQSRMKKKALIRMLIEVADEYDLEPALVVAVATQESMLDPKAQSHMGALGLMQLMPATARHFGVKNIFDPRQNARGGARYIRFLLSEFNGVVELALAAYNVGTAPVQEYQAVPPFQQTQTFVSRVLQLRDHYRQVL